MSYEDYKTEIFRIKSDPNYIKLASKHRGELDQKNFDKYKLKIAGLEAKMKLLEPSPVIKSKVKSTTSIKHPINPAIARMAREPNPNAKNKEKVIIKKSHMIVDRTSHAALVKSNEVDIFINGPNASENNTEEINNDIFDDLLFEEPMPDL